MFTIKKTDIGGISMPSKPINFRIGDIPYAELVIRALPGESASKTAQRLLTEFLTGSNELGLGNGGRPVEPRNLVMRNKKKKQ